MIFVEGGTFIMGCTDDECYENERPAHQVTLSSFLIGKYPVTQKEWVAIMGTNPSHFQGDNNLPVEMVGFNDVYEFITRLNEATGKNYRLCTEAEWEFAARGGIYSQGYKYSGSNNINEVAWYEENSNARTHPVGTKQPNELGIYDMSGNVSEWCWDWFGFYIAEAQTNPQGPSAGVGRVTRGGSWYLPVQDCRVSRRTSKLQESTSNYPGFRVALSL